MPRGIPWDELPNRYVKSTETDSKSNSTDASEEAAPHEFNLIEDTKSIGKRIAFGVIVSFSSSYLTTSTNLT